MYVEIYATLSLLSLAIIYGVIIKGVYDYIKFRTRNDLYLIFLFAFLVTPVILDLNRALLLLFLPLENWDFLFLWYIVSIFITFTGIAVLAKLFIDYAARMKIAARFWKGWAFVIFVFLILLTFFATIYPEFLPPLHDNSFTFRAVVILNPALNSMFLIIAEIIVLPFVVKFLQVVRKMRTRRWRRRALQATILIEILYFTIYFQMALMINWDTVIINAVMEFFISIIALIIFLPRNQGEAMFMQLQLESVYICEKSGVIDYTEVFTEGKNRDKYGKLIWGLVESTSNMVEKIRGVKHVGLGHILLEDKTAIIIEKSAKESRYYIVFTGRYSEFTHEQVKRLKNVLDDLYGKGLTSGINTLTPEVIEKTIHNIFFV